MCAALENIQNVSAEVSGPLELTTSWRNPMNSAFVFVIVQYQSKSFYSAVKNLNVHFPIVFLVYSLMLFCAVTYLTCFYGDGACDDSYYLFQSIISRQIFAQVETLRHNRDHFWHFCKGTLLLVFYTAHFVLDALLYFMPHSSMHHTSVHTVEPSKMMKK